MEIVKAKSRTLRMGASNPHRTEVCLSPSTPAHVGLFETLEVFRFALWGGVGELVLHQVGRIE